MLKSEIEDLMIAAQSDDVQLKLSPGFQTGFIANVVNKWERNIDLSDRELEILQDLVGRYIPSKRPPSNFSKRRYEGM